MKKNQKTWLLNVFFKNEDFAGWRNIAEKLIDTGSCITTNQGKDIWIGGIGNFINSESYGGGVDLIELTFDVNKFCSKENLFFMEYYDHYVEELRLEKKEAEKAAFNAPGVYAVQNELKVVH